MNVFHKCSLPKYKVCYCFLVKYLLYKPKKTCYVLTLAEEEVWNKGVLRIFLMAFIENLET